LEDARFKTIEVSFKDTLSNHGLLDKNPEHPHRKYFFDNFQDSCDVRLLIEKSLRPTLFEKMRNLCIRSINKIKKIF